MSDILIVERLRKAFGSEIVLEDISFRVPEHTATVFIGSSGSGKSTLLRCINLLEQIDDGVITLDGQEISAVEADVDDVRKKFGMVFQSFNLFPHKSVLENITLAPIHARGVDREQAVDEAMDLLNRFGLKDKAEQYPDRLSGGQQQRVAIIRSLALHPRMLLLDEITSALDPVLVNEVLSLVRELKSDGMTMLLATHEMGFAKQVADEVCFLHGGRILEWGRPEEILEAPKRSETQDFLRRVHEAGRL
ncbi:MAG: peptide ABC transporter ATP-binding protein [Actinobacteria bacterium BACL2 MAG-121001-bin67]|jgi:polar amino acid transport system ATP-binding protein|uniref:Peptide ABC transporter ATP-binding protein n=3 Tax=ac1 cluster TaxID=1655545 RepID=A0A0R2P3C7_9ACTN|nr:MAG: peptide ABC transporter ATP-binding protein [Actinobacteria bacterium BACL2 MAG-121001-bin67]KRO44656.1 MAG: peptide ABC transporter ATP-binding protein [Actinobacteria bacterium BACL2 MAG-120813-bin23]KRO53042.1 MAG: peptide ABC transporter ATP-binding protein [Actinobacteria bacterium BACL2 MAG-120820-bin50]KRO59740.1 MAG: peptide ABC transporter ATP-binding protein [Pelagibacteraceae bacterium BACL5 MAG-120705-bin12]KRO73900.1 MAG: peptide ABC transporter ATP-binding protein [Actinob